MIICVLFILMISFLHRFVFKRYIKWVLYDISLRSEYDGLRVHDSMEQVEAVCSFFCCWLKKCIYRNIYIGWLIRGPPVVFHFKKYERMENHQMKDIKYIIADNVRIYRKQRNLTQFELAEKAELSVDSIKRIERGNRTMSLENFMRIADALAVPLSYLLYETLSEIPLTERIRNVLNNKDKKQQEYLLHMVEEMSEGLEKLL